MTRGAMTRGAMSAARRATGTAAAVAAAAVLAALPSTVALAALNVQSCSVSNATVNFGVYDPTKPLPDDDNAGRLVLTCNVNGNGQVPVTVTLGSSTGSFNPRLLVNGINSLSYNLYTDATYSIVWGTGPGNQQFGTLDKTGTLTWVLYGRIPAGQLAAVPGTYTDTVQVTVSW